MSTEKRLYPALLWALLLLVAAAGCVSEHVDSDDGDTPAPQAVAFDSYLQDKRAATDTRSGQVGPLDDAALKASQGFSVFASYTGTAEFSSVKGEPFDFMWNQQVRYDEGTTPGQVTHWTYTPMKFWPNDNNPADTQTPPAEGSQLHSLLSFFAYAPWVAVPAGDTGITALTPNGTGADESAVTYRLPLSRKAAESVDLLWAYPQKDLYKTITSGEGTTTGSVRLHFIHALSKFTITVQGLFDHSTLTDDDPQYPQERDANTRVLVKSVELISPEMPREGRLFLVPADATPTQPRWELATDASAFSFSGTSLNAAVRYSTQPTKKEDFDALPEGVVNAEAKTLLSDSDPWFLLLPQSTPQRLKVRVVYYVITYDPQLTLNTPKGFSIVENDIEAEASSLLLLEANKVYTLRLLLGLTTVKFSVDVDDWAVPLMLDTVVKDPYTETHEANVE